MKKKNALSLFLILLFLAIISQTGCVKSLFPTTISESEPDLFPYALCVPLTSERESAIVSRVIDGDSIEVVMEGEKYQVRYIGIDAPEYGEGGDDLAELSRRFNQGLVEGKQVDLFRDFTDRDRYGRLLRYIFVDGLFVNREMVRQGFAESKPYPPDLACQVVISGDF